MKDYLSRAWAKLAITLAATAVFGNGCFLLGDDFFAIAG